MSSHRARAFLLLLAAALLTTGTAHGQATGTIRGVVRLASTNRPIDLAQVSVVGTQLGARTREDGTFQINNVPVGTLQVRVVRIGHAAVTRTVEVAAGQAVVLEFALREAPLALEELVVTGTAAEARKKELGNSLAAIRSEEILSVPVANIQDVIGARAAGVTVLANSGQPGAGGAIRLRGNNSISQSNAPVVYVDGIRIYSDAGPTNVFARQGALTMNDIPANDIERVEIVKGAAATTLYGTEASGGVIQIFTKRGVAGAPAWEAGMGFGYNDIDHIGPDSDETGFFVKQCRGAQLVNSAGQPFVDPTCPESGTWVQKGLVQRYSLSVRGGAQNLTYSLSGNYDDQEGAIQTGGAKVGSFRGNFTFAPRSDLNFQLSTGYTRRSIRWVGDGNNASGFLLNVSRGANSNYKNPVYCSGVATGTTCVANEEIFNESNYTRGDHFITGLVANWNPTARLTNRFSVGFDYSYSDDQSARPFGNYRSPAGIINKIDWLHTKLSIDYAGSYQAPLGESWTSTTSWGGQMFRDKDNFTRVDAQNFAGPGDPTIGGAANSSVLESDRIQVVNGGFFGQQMFGLRDRLFLTAGLRVDGNSAFGEDFGMQAYPKLGASWVAVDSRDGALQTARLRLAAGESGKAPGAFDAVKTWNPIAGDEGKPAVTPSQLGNPNLGPERTREIEGGFDLAALDGRLGVEATYFYARTFDALVPVDYPPSQGFIATQLENVGTLESKGLELSIEGNPIRSESFDWRLRGILTAVQTKAVDLNGEVIQFGDSRAEVREGYPVPSFFGRKITNPNDFAEPIVAEDQFLGSNYPDRVMSLQTTFVLFRRLTIDALGEWQTGAYVYNGIGYQNALRFVFQPCYEAQAKLNAFAGGDATALDDVTARDRGRCAIDRTKQNDRYWIDATDFFKLRTVSVTYDVPMAVAQKLRLRSASVTAAGRNLFTSTDYQGTDPEVADGRDAASDSGSGPLSSNTSRVGRRDYYNLPPLRSFVFTLRLGF